MFKHVFQSFDVEFLPFFSLVESVQYMFAQSFVVEFLPFSVVVESIRYRIELLLQCLNLRLHLGLKLEEQQCGNCARDQHSNQCPTSAWLHNGARGNAPLLNSL